MFPNDENLYTFVSMTVKNNKWYNGKWDIFPPETKYVWIIFLTTVLLQ